MRLIWLWDAFVIVSFFFGVGMLMEVVDRHSEHSISSAKRAEKRQADLSPDEYIALMKEKAKEAGIKQRKAK